MLRVAISHVWFIHGQKPNSYPVVGVSRSRSYEKYQLEHPRVSIASLIQSRSHWKKSPRGAGALFSSVMMAALGRH
jgi:hypothetical protein